MASTKRPVKKSPCDRDKSNEANGRDESLRSRCRIKAGAIDAAALGPFNKPTVADDRDEKRKVFSILVVISVVSTISGKSLKLLPPDVIFYS